MRLQLWKPSVRPNWRWKTRVARWITPWRWLSWLKRLLSCAPSSRSAKNWASVKLPGLAAKETRTVLQCGFFYICWCAAALRLGPWPADPRKTGQALSFPVWLRKKPVLFCSAGFFYFCWSAAALRLEPWPADPRKTGQALSFPVWLRKNPVLFCSAGFFISAGALLKEHYVAADTKFIRTSTGKIKKNSYSTRHKVGV